MAKKNHPPGTPTVIFESGAYRRATEYTEAEGTAFAERGRYVGPGTDSEACCSYYDMGGNRTLIVDTLNHVAYFIHDWTPVRRPR